jgi:lipoprotein-anchoring transpeptidase ErfK/SrfK
MMQSSGASTTPVQTARPRRGSCAAVFAILLLWLLIIALVAGAVAGLAKIYTGDRILAGTQALGRDLGGRTPDEAAALLRADWQNHTIVLDGEGQSWTLAPDQIGAVLDAEATAARAYRQGRVEPSLENLLPLATPETLLPLAQRLLATAGLLAYAEVPTSVQPDWRFDRAMAAETLHALAGQLEITPQDAGVGIVDSQIRTTPPITGRAVDIAAMLATLERQPWETLFARGSSSSVRFILPVVTRLPAITDVSAIVNEVTPLLAAPITVRLYDPIRDERSTWIASPADTSRWLSFQVTGMGADKKISWSVDETKVADYITAQNHAFGDERYVDSTLILAALVEAFKAGQPEISQRVSHGEREHIVKSGETLSSIAFDYGMPYPWLLKSNPGIGDDLFVGDAIKIPSADGLLPLPVVENKRIKISLKDQKMQAYEDGKLKWDWVASTGIASSPTSPGVFQIQSHEPMAYAANWDLHMPSFMGIYRPVPDQAFMNGFHGFPSRDQKQILWTRNLGKPITYGCILLDSKNAKLLYDWAEEGVVVEITA